MDATSLKQLELAARAAGYVPVGLTDDGTALLLDGIQQPWNPRDDNPHSDCMGDALRLAVQLNMTLDVLPWGSTAKRWDDVKTDLDAERHNEDPFAATRRAVVRAACRGIQQRTTANEGGGVMDKAYLQAEFDNFFEFDTADRSTVSSVSARLFAEAMAQPLEHEIERLRAELADALDVKRGDGPTALSMVIADRDALRADLSAAQAREEANREMVTDCLVAASEAIADQDDRAAQSHLREVLKENALKRDDTALGDPQ